MPHECTDCGRAFDDGSKEMLSGCPDCGGNTFQFRPDGVETEDSGAPEETTAPSEPPEPEVNSTVARTVGNAATAVRDFVGGSESPGYPEDNPPGYPKESPEEAAVSGGDAPPEPSPSKQEPTLETSASGGITADTPSQEDAAQASARSEVVSPDDLPESPDSAVRERPAPVVDESSEQPEPENRPDLDELREQLNEQFESIRVVAPGQYELNLMELYDREEYIIALQEDGKYTIQVPERWGE
jgi:predicted  nucleic acid-binding Zn-ribbon protein